MRSGALRIVVLGLSLSSSWGNGHATTYRSLLRALSQRGHDILFLERDVPWYASTRDLTHPDYCRLAGHALAQSAFSGTWTRRQHWLSCAIIRIIRCAARFPASMPF